MSLGQYIEDLAYDAVFWLQGLENPDYPIAQLGGLSLEVSTKFRALAIVTLLTEGQPDLFHHNLIRSGRARQLYLERLRRENIESDHHRASGRYKPLLDLVAANDIERARVIISLSPRDMMNRHEYEDDYCYAQVMHSFVEGSRAEPEIPAFLNRLEEYLDGDPSARLAVCRALLERDNAAFEDAFESLLMEREVEIEQARERAQLEDVILAAEREVFVEGLAVLRLATMRGLSTQSDYRFCPSLARVPMTRPFPGE